MSLSNSDIRVDSKEEMYSFYINDIKLQYFYFENDLDVHSKSNEIINGCLLSGKTNISYEGHIHPFDQFDFFFLPPGQSLTIQPNPKLSIKNKLCLYCPIQEQINLPFEIQHYSEDKFIDRGEHSSNTTMATYRTVWTAFRNGYFMSGFTNIPLASLKSGVITSVNLEKTKEGTVEIYSHIHPKYSEVYIMCIDDENYSISQYLINTEGKSVCKDLSDGEGLFFPGSLGHSNFCRPYYKEIKFCMYMWIIATRGETETVDPITLRV